MGQVKEVSADIPSHLVSQKEEKVTGSCKNYSQNFSFDSVSQSLCCGFSCSISWPSSQLWQIPIGLIMQKSMGWMWEGTLIFLDIEMYLGIKYNEIYSGRNHIA